MRLAVGAWMGAELVSQEAEPASEVEGPALEAA